MKIMIINSRYFLSAGPEKYMFSVTKVLEEHGHEVYPFSTQHSDNKKTEYEQDFVAPIGGKDMVYFEQYKKTPKTIMQALGRQFYSFEVKSKLRSFLQKIQPDIVYILHHQNKLSPSIIDACRKEKVPVVMRISDFSLVCTRNNLMLNGQVCEKCIKNKLWNSVTHKCVKDSAVYSAVKAAALGFYRMTGIYNKVSAVVFPSQHTLDKISYVFKGPRLEYIPTLVPTSDKPKITTGDYALFVGRLEEEKGLLDAIKAFEGTQYTFYIVGKSHSGYDTVLKDYVRKNKIGNVAFLGAQFGNDLKKLYENCRCTINTVRWYENLPNTALESMQYAKPIVASYIGSMKDVVVDQENGLTVEPGNVEEIRAAITRLFEDDALCKKLGKGGYERILNMYDPQIHYKKVIALFEEVVQEAKN